MRPETAIALIEGLIFKPGWTIEATDFTDRFEDTVCVCLSCDTYRFNRSDAAEGYQFQMRPQAKFLIMVGEFRDECDLYRKIIECIIDFETHESREALRVEATLWAPFHPHRHDGMLRWGTPDHDLTYGVVG